MNSLLLVGAGGHARSCIDVIELENRFSIAGMISLPAEVGLTVLNYQIVGTDIDLPRLASKIKNALVVIGQIKTPALRMVSFQQLEANGYKLPVIISPIARVSPHAKVGIGTVVMHNAVINASAVVGRNCIINSQALIEHDVSIGDHCHIATAATINGNVTIGDGSFIGSGVLVRQGVSIGANCVIGMGQIVLADCADNTHLPLATRKKLCKP